MNEKSETEYIFGTKIPKPDEDKGIPWAPPRKREGQVPTPHAMYQFVKANVEALHPNSGRIFGHQFFSFDSFNPISL